MAYSFARLDRRHRQSEMFSRHGLVVDHKATYDISIFVLEPRMMVPTSISATFLLRPSEEVLLPRSQPYSLPWKLAVSNDNDTRRKETELRVP